MKRRMIARAALVTDRDVFCLFRKRKLRQFAIQSCLPIQYCEPVGYFEMIRHWGLQEVLYQAPPRVVRTIIQCVPILRELREKITAGLGTRSWNAWSGWLLRWPLCLVVACRPTEQPTRLSLGFSASGVPNENTSQAQKPRRNSMGSGLNGLRPPLSRCGRSVSLPCA